MTTAAGRGAVDAVVVAAGESRRMAGSDKLAAQIGGRPLLAWTLERLAAAPEIDRIVVVTAADRLAAVGGASWLPAAVIDVVAGGPRRQESVAAGVARLAREPGGGDPDRLILVQDGARPLVSTDLVAAVAAAAREHGAAIPVAGPGRDGQAGRRWADRGDPRSGRAGHRPDPAGHPARTPRAGLRGLSTRRTADVHR